MSVLPNSPSLVKCNGLPNFLIFDAPNDDNLSLYMTELKRHNVVAVARACESTYNKKRLEKEGIEVLELEFPDGGAPTDSVVREWKKLVKSTISKQEETGVQACIGVHCVAGLGRAPVLVAIALIEGGMPPLQAVEYIRKSRRGSINAKQLQWLRKYKAGRSDACLVQ